MDSIMSNIILEVVNHPYWCTFCGMQASGQKET
jgi:hypothetical protein